MNEQGMHWRQAGKSRGGLGQFCFPVLHFTKDTDNQRTGRAGRRGPGAGGWGLACLRGDSGGHGCCELISVCRGRRQEGSGQALSSSAWRHSSHSLGGAGTKQA